MIKFSFNNFKLTSGDFAEIPCRVPCSLYSALLENKLIDEPYYRENYKYTNRELSASAEFTSVVTLNTSVLSRERIYLSVRGVLGVAEIIFNGKSYGEIFSSEKNHLFDIKDIVKSGDNILVVSVKRPLPAIKRLKVRGGTLETVSDYPDLHDMGLIYAPEILASNGPIIKNVEIKQRHGDGRVNLDLSISTIGSLGDTRAVATLVSPLGSMYFTALNNGTGSILVPDPLLWWPRGLGEAYLYKLTVTVYKGEEAEDITEFNIGLRQFEVHLGEGDKPRVFINGRDFLPFALTYRKEDLILPKISADTTAKLMEKVVFSGVNALCVAPSEIHPHDSFYELCDKMGVVAIESLYYPYSKDNGAGLTLMASEEFSELCHRIANHASVLVLNVETVTEAGGDIPSSPDVAKEFQDFLFRAAKAALVKNDEGLNLYKKNFNCMPYTDIISPPTVKTTEEFTLVNDRNITSAVMESHSSGSEKIGEMVLSIIDEYRFPSGFCDLTYAGQLISAKNFADYFSEVRMARDTVVKDCYPPLNDAWHEISSSAVDYLGRKKAFCYSLAKIYSPIAVISRANEGKVYFGISNESRRDFSGTLTYALYDASDKCIKEKSVEISVPQCSSVFAAEADMNEYMKDCPSEYFVIYSLSDKNHVVASSTVRFAPSKHFRFSNPDIKAVISGSGRDFEIVLSSASYAASVEVDFTDIDAEFSDNYFDLLASVPKKVAFKTSVPMSADKLKEMLTLRSVYSIGNAEEN